MSSGNSPKDSSLVPLANQSTPAPLQIQFVVTFTCLNNYFPSKSSSGSFFTAEQPKACLLGFSSPFRENTFPVSARDFPIMRDNDSESDYEC